MYENQIFAQNTMCVSPIVIQITYGDMLIHVFLYKYSYGVPLGPSCSRAVNKHTRCHDDTIVRQHDGDGTMTRWGWHDGTMKMTRCNIASSSSCHRSIAPSPSCHSVIVIVLSCHHHRVIVPSPSCHHHRVIELSCYRAVNKHTRCHDSTMTRW